MLTGFLCNLPGLGAVWWVVGVYQGFLGCRFAGCVGVTSSVSKNKLFIVYAWSSVIALFFLISAPLVRYAVWFALCTWVLIGLGIVLCNCDLVGLRWFHLYGLQAVEALRGKSSSA